MIVVIVRDEGDVDHIWVITSGDSMLVGKGLTANWQWKCSVQNWICDDGFVIRLIEDVYKRQMQALRQVLRLLEWASKLY